MTGPEYTAARKALGLTQEQMADWLGVRLRTAANYAQRGPMPPAALAIVLTLAMGPAARAAALKLKGFEI